MEQAGRQFAFRSNRSTLTIVGQMIITIDMNVGFRMNAPTQFLNVREGAGLTFAHRQQVRCRVLASIVGYLSPGKMYARAKLFVYV